MFEIQRYSGRDIHIEPGDTMLLYTDGVVATVDEAGEFFGLDRLRGLLRSTVTGRTAGLTTPDTAPGRNCRLRRYLTKTPQLEALVQT